MLTTQSQKSLKSKENHKLLNFASKVFKKHQSYIHMETDIRINTTVECLILYILDFIDFIIVAELLMIF